MRRHEAAQYVVPRGPLSVQPDPLRTPGAERDCMKLTERKIETLTVEDGGEGSLLLTMRSVALRSGQRRAVVGFLSRNTHCTAKNGAYR